MYVVETVFGFLGAVFFLLCLRWSIEIEKKFQEDSELAATRIFLHDSVISSLKVAVAVSVVFGLTGLVSLIGISRGAQLLSNLIRVGSGVLFLGYMYFHYSTEKAVKQD
jgi:hypothetical protein